MIYKLFFSFTLSIFLFTPSIVSAQGRLTDDMKETEEKLLASTKQVNQFFRRFNGEEDQHGHRLYQTDRDFRDTGLRKNYLPRLFDRESGYVSDDLAKEFIRDVTSKKEPCYMDFHSGEWFAEVNSNFIYKGKKQSVLLYMKIQHQGKGYEWVISDVAFEPFKRMFKKDTSAGKKFIHPMSHELEFMNLNKAFRNSENNPEAFTPREYQPDYLTLFLYEMKKGNLSFETVKNVKFHYFGIDGWYFELSNFNRPGFNTGWLISNLVKAGEREKELLKAYIYDKN